MARVTLEDNTGDFLRAVERAITPALETAGALLQGDMQVILTNPSPSAPGNPPGIVTGQLRDSIVFESVEPGRVAVGTNIEYGPYLEFGTADMAPRPWARPAFDRSRRGMISVARETFENAIVEWGRGTV